VRPGPNIGRDQLATIAIHSSRAKSPCDVGVQVRPVPGTGFEPVWCCHQRGLSRSLTVIFGVVGWWPVPLSWAFAVGPVRLVPSDSAPIRPVRDYFATKDEFGAEHASGPANDRTPRQAHGHSRCTRFSAAVMARSTSWSAMNR
jgi:hypothetical protein